MTCWPPAIDASGNVAFDATIGELVIDTTAPTVSIAAVTPNPRVSPVDSIAIQFSEPVAGFGLEDLQFTLGGVSLPLNGATLTTSDQQNWTLGNLSAMTAPSATTNSRWRRPGRASPTWPETH